jgi:uncharacterized ferritin-like protein (DUF455 family)
MELRQRALQALCAADPREKAALATALCADARQLPISPTAPLPSATLPGRPALPRLVHPARVPRRSPATPDGLAALLHAIAHIEFNAINLAADCAWRFDGMPRAFHEDWARIAGEEAHHFCLLAALLEDLGHRYGEFPAHDGLWAMCEKTSGDLVARLALVPRTLEARGLDATPLIQQKLRRVTTPGAARAVEILDVILRDEIGHVAAGNRWYREVCAQRGLDPLAHYPLLVEQYCAPRLVPPFNEEARRRAGFTPEEMAWLLRQEPGTQECGRGDPLRPVPTADPELPRR